MKGSTDIGSTVAQKYWTRMEMVLLTGVKRFIVERSIA
jgi:hypothetical protein